MNPAFQPPPDYTRREVEATKDRVSCPFYGVGLHPVQHHQPARALECGGYLIGNGGNRCALITSAHSPCWMEVGEGCAPDWTQCPRNPEFVAINIFENLHDDSVTARQGDVRLLASVRHLNRLKSRRARAAGEIPTMPAEEIPE